MKLDAIVADKDDDAPRLVLADALQEQGDPRGEFISIQCETERLGLGPPRIFRDWLRDGLAGEAKTSPRVGKLLRREAELLRAHGKAWAGEAWGFAKDAWVFRRGFVEQLGFGKKTQTLAQAFAVAPLVETVQHFGDWLDAERVREWWIGPEAAQLRELYLPGAGTQLAAFADIATLAGLRRLSLNHAGGPHDLVALARAHFPSTLSGLVVTCMKLEAGSTRTTLEGMRALTELQLIDTRLGVTGAGALAALEFPSLDVLAVRHGKIGDEGARMLLEAAYAPQLRALDLRKNGLTDAGGILERCPRLAVLELSGNSLGESLAGWIGAAAPELDVLGFEGCGLVDADVTALVASPVWSRIGVLDLRKNELTDASAHALAKAAGPRLRALHVAGNALTAAGKKALKTLSARVY
ncbi:MAG: TIGR02996 domain-containing protein [Myxococcales bacterium]|nr:TIGR02996 domain-containing protein [Myxococcales bacterium]